MSTLLVFLMTLSQLVAIAVGYFVPVPWLYDVFVVYGSPVYFIMNLLGSGSVAHEEQLLYPLIAAFQVVKYVALCRSQMNEYRNSLHYLAIIFEVTYLIICFNA